MTVQANPLIRNNTPSGGDASKRASILKRFTFVLYGVRT